MSVGRAAWALVALSGALGAPEPRAPEGARGVPEPVTTWWGTPHPRSSEDSSDSGHSGVHALVGGEAAAEAPAYDEIRLPPDLADFGLQRPVLDTAQSFSVAAWVRLDDTENRPAAVVAQSGQAQSAFALAYVGGNFAFGASHSDDPRAQWHYAWAQVSPPIGEWVHLVGVFDQGCGQLRLYLGGVRAAQHPAPRMWQARGAMTVGRALMGADQTAPWPGALEEVRVFASALTDANVLALYRASSALLGE